MLEELRALKKYADAERTADAYKQVADTAVALYGQAGTAISALDLIRTHDRYYRKFRIALITENAKGGQAG